MSTGRRGAVRLCQDDRRRARPMLRAATRLRFKFILTMAANEPIRLPKLGASPARRGGRLLDVSKRWTQNEQMFRFGPDKRISDLRVNETRPRSMLACRFT